MKTIHLLSLAACGVCAVALPACKKGQSGPVVAHVGNDVITAEDFKRRMDEQTPFLRARYNSVERKKELLHALIRNELLAQEAQREGLDKSPGVRDAMKRAMIQELIKKQLDEKASGSDIPDAELKAFYEAHIDDYVKPERARVYHIFLAAKDAKEKAQAKAKATALIKDIREREKKGEPNAFEKTAMKESKDQLSAPMGGDLRFVSKEELAKAHGPEVANAAFDLKTPGEIAGPVETPNGVEIVKLQVKTVALNRSFEEAKEAIRGRMARDRRSKQYDEFVKKLEDGGKVSIDEGELAKVNPAEGAAPVGTPVTMPTPAGPAPATAKIGGN
ncbi:MAG TPA: peptidyl-prolyl cis-trans isomerase [Myxococcales bacterium]|nr:peptidyl-prolyl cis-trans isomerase [Myxococcales bacterium]